MVDVPGNPSTSSVGSSITEVFGSGGNRDWFGAVGPDRNLRFELSGAGTRLLAETSLGNWQAGGDLLQDNSFVQTSGDIPNNSSTTASIAVGQTVSGTLDTIGDRDWYRLSLSAGQEVRIDLSGIAPGPVGDTYLRVLDANGNLIYENDDTGSSLNSSLAFRAATSGTYFVDVGSYDDRGSGTYQLSVRPFQMPPEFTYQQIADQLVRGYWGGESFRFPVSQGGTLTVNLMELTASGRTLARAALNEWSQITGLRFMEVASDGQITFDDDQEGAHTEYTSNFNYITSSHVNVSSDWLRDYGTGLNTYSYQTYLHEIGHALGLGHAGDYNGEATYPYDALFRNDSWAVTIMSYFDQTDNTGTAEQGFTRAFLVTPMVADILAMSMLYGLSTTTRAGDTVYGSDWADGMGARTLFDAGGIDTIDVSAQTLGATINLNSGSFSNVAGRVGVVSIAIGTVIENATGSSVADRLIGNDASNILLGNAGNDELTGGAGNDVLNGGVGADILDGGAGDDRILYDPADSRITGGSGRDVLLIEGMAAPLSFNLSANGLEAAEVTQWDRAGNAWNFIVQVYNTGWQLTEQTTGYDDLSKLIVQLDPANLVNTSQIWSSFDIVSRLSSVDQLFDDGTRTFINVDENNSQIWAQDWFTYDAQGRLDSEDVRYDAGARTFINFDQANAHNWAQDWFTYDAAGRLDSEDILYDNGSRTFINLDQDNSQPWSQAWFTYDAQGRLDTQDVHYDDGRRMFVNYDQDNSQPFTSTTLVYNSNGSPNHQVISWDDGSTSYTYF